MTLYQLMLQFLTERGMFDNDAKQVVEIAKAKISETVPGYQFTWDRPADEYPQVVQNMLLISLKQTCLKWIEENKPMAWFKPMFE